MSKHFDRDQIKSWLNVMQNLWLFDLDHYRDLGFQLNWLNDTELRISCLPGRNAWKEFNILISRYFFMSLCSLFFVSVQWHHNNDSNCKYCCLLNCMCNMFPESKIRALCQGPRNFHLKRVWHLIKSKSTWSELVDI